MNYKCLIVDDEMLARKLIAAHVAKIEGLHTLEECSDAIEAGNCLRTHQVDLIFLDIQMPEIDGLKFIGTLKNPPAVILTTAHRDFAAEAFEVDAVDFLLKPISFERFLKAVNKFFDRRTSNITKVVADGADDFIYLKADRKMHRIPLSEVVYVESMDEYVRVHLLNGVLVTRENISTIGTKLEGNGFVRIHRSYIISRRYVTSISADGVEVRGKQLPFGRAYKQVAVANLGVKTK
jgi:DNA-binding LytR/AlgR family response regulator